MSSLRSNESPSRIADEALGALFARVAFRVVRLVFEACVFLVEDDPDVFFAARLDLLVVFFAGEGFFPLVFLVVFRAICFTPIHRNESDRLTNYSTYGLVTLPYVTILVRHLRPADSFCVHTHAAARRINAQR